MIPRALPLALAALSLTPIGTSQAPSSTAGTVPEANRFAPGNSNNALPFSGGTTRYQQVFLERELPALRTIVGLGLRFDEAFPWTFHGQEIDLSITLAYTTQTPATLDETFDNNRNVGTPGPVLVLPRTKFRLPDQLRPRFTNPTKFEVQIPFLIPFAWQQSPGRNLLIEVRLFGNSNRNAPFPYPFDATLGNGATTSRLFASNTSALRGTVTRNQGLVMNFLDRIEPRATYQAFGSACPGNGGRAGVITPRIAQSVWGQSSLSLGGRTNYYQQVISGVEVGGAATFRGMEFRTKISEFDIDSRDVGMEIRVGHTTADPSSLSTTFATNVTSPLVTVLPSSIVRLPRIEERNRDLAYFRIRIPWTRPFSWQPIPGRNLLVEIKTGDPQVLSYPADSFSRVANSGLLWSRNLTATTGSARSGTGFIIRLTTDGRGTLPPRLHRSGRPLMGTSFEVHLSDAAFSQPAMLFFGSSKTRWGATPLPFALSALGGGSCRLHVSPDIALPVITDPAGSVTIPISIPNSPALSGMEWHNQWAIRDPGANTMGASWTGAATARIGSL